MSSLDLDSAGSINHGSVTYNSLIVHNGASKVVNVDGYLFIANSYYTNYYLIDYIGNDTVLTLPESYNGKKYSIYSYAFYNRDDITEVIISDGVVKIGRYAFENCSNLEKVSIGNNVTTIDSRAVCTCDALSSIIIPKNVTAMESIVFYWSDITIYCVAEAKPEGWSNDWNYETHGEVIWGYKE